MFIEPEHRQWHIEKIDDEGRSTSYHLAHADIFVRKQTFDKDLPD